MIIDCHGHYTTAPDELGDYREAQKAALKADPAHAGVRKAALLSAMTRSGKVWKTASLNSSENEEPIAQSFHLGLPGWALM